MRCAPQPFDWAPAEGQRHASTDARPGSGYPTGFVVATLCGYQLRADNTEPAWRWETCATCKAKARKLSQAPAVGAR
ncbi:zinc finger protein [Saccharopolyspora phatthalungensis]|uniref:zinc finger protein n=1 Tax=Saccharopolyspora phatthalungensis TaxID=664693 RepID=UPI00160E1099|nr:zinc finger protein [Saccharopolyspora phatthalungensis]